ncbi:PAS fold-containing protein [Nocardioides scoriae]|uniref:Sensor-like histidine kinase SenX3 n=1 Tax=Nocardioides scoriae TaxID=642780 RepID=A0A1H1Y462_9ACTN|nr:ATP-binding protein [Nocardioides scoriae]SDT16223.1 PAS fold-containing protein [Nocardioides scoriae]
MASAVSTGSGMPAGLTGRGQAVRWVLLVAATWLAADLGYATFREEFATSLVWPLSGVALVWAATGSRTTWPVDAVLLVAATSLALEAAGATTGRAAMGALQVVVQALVYQLLMLRWAPSVWGSGGTRRLSRLPDLGAFLGAVLLSSLAASAVRVLGLGLIPTPDLADALLVTVRSTCWSVAIAAVVLQAGPGVAAALRDHDVATTVASWAPRSGRHLVEVVLLVVITVAVYAVVFSRRQPLPVTFLLTLPTVWAGLRLHPVTAVVHAAASGVGAVTFTLLGSGVFARLDDPRFGAALSQALLVALVVTALSLSCVMSERTEALERAQRSEAFSAQRATLLAAILEQIREGIVVVQEDRTVVIRNPAGMHLLGLDGPQEDAAEDIGGVLYDLHGEAVPRDRRPIARALAGSEVVGENYVVRGPTLSGARVMEISASPLPGAEGQRQALVTFRDVTLVREREDNLASFAGVVAHDLNNPLTVVSGWAESLAESFGEGPVGPEDGRAMTSRILGAAAHMRRFIDDLLSYTVARDQSLTPQDLDLSEVAEEVARLRRDGAARPRIEVQPGIRVRADVVLVRQLVDNLMGNAVKYVAPQTRPRISLSARTVGEMVEVCVEDNGIGVPVNLRERIFETFVRAHGDAYGGTGLGLGICRRVVQRHGGEIHVEEGPDGVGSRFVFTLPRSASPGASPGVAQPTSAP